MKLFAVIFSLTGLALLFFSFDESPQASPVVYYPSDEADFKLVSVQLDNLNSGVYNQFQVSVANKVDSANAYYQKAMQVRQMANELSLYISELRGDFVAQYANVDRKAADTLRTSLISGLDNQDFPKTFFAGRVSPQTSLGGLKTKLKNFYKQSISLVKAPSMIRSSIFCTSCQDQYLAEKKVIPWEEYEFSGISVGAALARFAALRAEVKTAENVVITELFHELPPPAPAK